MEYHSFFTALLESINKELPEFTHSRKVNYNPWKSSPTGVTGAIYSVAFKTGNHLSCELYFDSEVKEQNKQRFDKFFENREKIESVLGELSWERLDDKKGCRIAVYTEFTDEKDMVIWATGKLKEFRACFKQYINMF